LRNSFSEAKFFQKCKVMHSFFGEDFMMQKAGVTVGVVIRSRE
jgi:hypothetical protein